VEKGKAMPFWTELTLEQMNQDQWESLCDGCGKCCLIRLEDDENGDIHTTDVHCRLFDSATCRCTNYPERQKHVPDCIKLTPDQVGKLHWLPRTCAYRLIEEGKPLFDWHPLISGDPNSVHEAGISIANQTINEDKVRLRHLVRHIKVWPGEESD
jgi:uncharacterized protein